MGKENKPKITVYVVSRLFSNGELSMEFVKTGEKGYSKRVNGQTEQLKWFGLYTAQDLDVFKGLIRDKKADLGTLIDTIKMTPQQSEKPDIIIYTDPGHKCGYGLRKIYEIRRE